MSTDRKNSMEEDYLDIGVDGDWFDTNYMYGKTYTTTGPITYNIGDLGLPPLTTTTTLTSTPTVTLDPTPRDLNIDGDIKIDGQSLKEFMSVVSERLNILTPKPEVLEKYEALREAYENYKMLEKICLDDGKVHEET